MNTTQHLAKLLALTAADFDRYLETVNQLARLRRNVEAAVPSHPPMLPSPAEAPSPQTTAPVSPQKVSEPPADLTPKPGPLAARPPMRAPKSGTLRGEIHEILRAGGKPLRRAEIIAAVAKRRGQPVDEMLAAKLGEIVRNPHDPFLRRVARGIYEFVAQEAPSL